MGKRRSQTEIVKQNAGGLSQLSQKQACGASRSLVGVQHDLLPRLGVGRGNVTSALAPGKLEAEPLFVVPSFVSGPQPDICWHDIDRTMPQDKPMRL